MRTFVSPSVTSSGCKKTNYLRREALERQCYT